jgi:hypothetical protein
VQVRFQVEIEIEIENQMFNLSQFVRIDDPLYRPLRAVDGL